MTDMKINASILHSGYLQFLQNCYSIMYVYIAFIMIMYSQFHETFMFGHSFLKLDKIVMKYCSREIQKHEISQAY